MSSHTHRSPPPLRGRSASEASREGGKPSHRPISEQHRGYAKGLRHEMTEAEKRLRFASRAHRLNGLSFRRQVPIGSFIVDFICNEHKLIIEVDGGQHAESQKDIQRDRWLVSKRYRVLGFWNADVVRNRSGVLQVIVDAVREVTPLPSPPPQGGREPVRAAGESAS